MGIGYVCKRHAAFAAGTALLLSLSLAGCASSAGSSLLDARAEVPMPPETSAYLPVEDLPSPRDKLPMTPDERSKLENELIVARDRQAVARKAQGAAITEPAKP